MYRFSEGDQFLLHEGQSERGGFGKSEPRAHFVNLHGGANSIFPSVPVVLVENSFMQVQAIVPGILSRAIATAVA